MWKKKIRKVHTYLGIFIGFQLLLWTISGLYFSWSDIDRIHGDHFLKENIKPIAYNNLKSPTEIMGKKPVYSVALRSLGEKAFYWINDSLLIDAQSGEVKNGISEEEALLIAADKVADELEIEKIEKITQTDRHHEYRNRNLPAYLISYKGNEGVHVYISVNDASFQRIRHSSWRVFDFLWMTHTMDYKGRDNFNTLVLRVFSLLGLVTVLSGYLMWFLSFRKTKKYGEK